MPDKIDQELIDDELAEIKGLMVNVYGKPNRQFNTVKEVDDFIGEVEKILVDYQSYYASKLPILEELERIICLQSCSGTCNPDLDFDDCRKKGFLCYCKCRDIAQAILTRLKKGV